MRKPMYWALAAMLCGSTMIGYTSCGDDDDDDNGPSVSTSDLKKPVEGTDFTATVNGNSVTIASSLSYGTMYVIFDGTQYDLKDGKVEISLPVKGDYKMTFNIYDSGKSVTSDEFTVSITATDLSFLNNGIYKVLTGGQAAYEEAAKTADENGVFTRSWRLDAFFNETGNDYSKVFPGPGSFALEKDEACYNGGVTATGSGAWRALGAVEDATISFDFVSMKVKVDFKDGVKLQTAGGTAAANKEEELKGTFYGTFSATAIEGNANYLAAIDGWAGTTSDVNGLEITLKGDNVRIPFLKGALSYPLSKEADVTTFQLFSSVSNEENEQGIIINSAVSYNSGSDDDGNPTVAEDFCNLAMTYVCEELESTYQFKVPAAEVAGEWVSKICIWGNGDDAPTLEAKDVTVKGDGEYEYTAEVTKAGVGECMVIHFDSKDSYAQFLGEGATGKVESVEVTINGEKVEFEAMDFVGADGGTQNFRIQFFNTWGSIGTSYEFPEGTISIKVKYSGM